MAYRTDPITDDESVEIFEAFGMEVLETRYIDGRRYHVLDPQEFLSVEQVAELLDMNVRTVQRWCASGKMPAVRFTPSPGKPQSKEWSIPWRYFDRVLEKQPVMSGSQRLSDR
jgi:hypothetical protein